MDGAEYRSTEARRMDYGGPYIHIPSVPTSESWVDAQGLGGVQLHDPRTPKNIELSD